VTDVEFFVDPSCPWVWITSRWIKEVAPQRDLKVTWRSHCLEIMDDYGVVPTMPEAHRATAVAAHAIAHRMLRIFEAVRAESGEGPIDALYTDWGTRFFATGAGYGENLLTETLAACGIDPGRVKAADEEKWDGPIQESMEVAYAFGGAQDPVADHRRALRPAPRVQGSGHGARAHRRRCPAPLGR